MTGDAREITRDHAGASVGAERSRLDVGGAAELVGEAGGGRRRRRPPCWRRGRGTAPRAAPSLERASQARGGRAARRRGVRQPALGGGSEPRGDGGEGRGKVTHTRTTAVDFRLRGWAGIPPLSTGTQRFGPIPARMTPTSTGGPGPPTATAGSGRCSSTAHAPGWSPNPIPRSSRCAPTLCSLDQPGLPRYCQSTVLLLGYSCGTARVLLRC